MEQIYKYLLVGGMPEAVEAYIDGNNLLEAREILKVLYDNYLSDMELYQASQEAVLRSRVLFQNIYRELNKESKSFFPRTHREKKQNERLCNLYSVAYNGACCKSIFPTERTHYNTAYAG